MSHGDGYITVYQGAQLMAAPLRVTNEELIQAYQETGSVWKAAKRLGVVGQSVWERLRALGHPMSVRRWTADEVAEMQALAQTCTAAEIANRLGRSFASVACKMSELGLYSRGRRQRALFPALKRGSGITRDVVKRWAREVQVWDGSLRAFAIARGINLETLAQALQKHYPDVWEQVAPRLDVAPRPCPQCGRDFIPSSAKQKCCSRVCTSKLRVDLRYFGGRRSQTIGLAEGVCQLCQRETKRGLSSHHLIGKENDPDNALLVALCQGCHQLVGLLASRTLVDTEEGWQRLIEFALQRRLGGVQPASVAGFHVCVDIDWLTEEDVRDLGESA